MAVGAAIIATTGSSQSRADASTIQPLTQRFAVFSQNALPASPGSLSEKAQLWLASVRANQQVRLDAEAPQKAEELSVTSLATIETGDRATVVAALGDDEICALDEASEVGTCATADLAEAGHAFSATPAGCDAYHVIGFMPDGVSSLEVEASGEEIPVTSNVYDATLSAEDTTLTSQQSSVEVVLPLGEYANMNPAC
ncbi:MAG TPA: hypothetical protein VFI17_09845 [Solirubrobacterales bacterium]|nr:hypothetical protein [Solirubrobacterales bacterium]